MTSQVILNTFANDYKDDYRDSDDFARILFNPRRAVQARELTQLQTIVQAQLRRFGDNIFKDGAAVNPSTNVSVNPVYPFVKLIETDISGADLDTEFTGDTSGVSAKLTEKVDAVDSDPATFYIRYTQGSSTLTTGTKFAPGETISNGVVSYTVQTTNTTENPAIGNGSRVAVSQGEFYTQGFFTRAGAQSIILSKYTSNPTANIGFTVSEEIVTAADDERLYDNQGDVPNLTAPGADRYRVRLVLIDEADKDSDQTFVYVARVENGTVVEINNGRDDYNKILDLIAERTAEESGDYTVRPFIANFKEDSADTHLLLDINSSVGYVDGYRQESWPTQIRIPKPTDTTTLNNETVAANFGNYVICSSILGIPDVSEYELVNIYDAPTSGNIIGTCRVRSLEEATGSVYKLYIFQVKMHTGKSFRNARALGTSATENAIIQLENGNAVVKEQKNNNLFFDLPRWRPYSISAVDYTYTVLRHATHTASTNTVTLGFDHSGESFARTSEWLFTQTSDGSLIVPTSIDTGTGLVTFTSATGSIDCLYLIQKGGASAPTPYKTKNLVETTVATTVTVDSDGTYVNLSKPDILSVSRVRATDSDGANLINKFYLDNGQRDNYYDMGRMVLAPGQANPGGTVFVRFKHFQHTGVGDFFCISSYDIPTDITYADVPLYRQTNGETVPLRDVLDFRPTINEERTSFTTGTNPLFSELPLNTDLITVDPTYYMPRKDALLLDANTGIRYRTGTSGLDPQLPITASNTMQLYNFELNPNTLNKSDLSAQYIDNRGYTMRDIGKLHKEINNVKQLATLSLLDMQATSLEVLDSDGLTRTKAGFLTDDFRDHRAAMVDDLEYRASIDPTAGIMRPAFREKNIPLAFDSAAISGVSSSTSSNCILKADNLMLDYTHELYITQPHASTTENVNPYIMTFYRGVIVLSPNSDESRDTVEFSVRVDQRSEVDIETFLNRTLGEEDTRSIMNTVESDPQFGGRNAFIRHKISLAAASNFTSSGTLEEAVQALPPATNQILAQVFDTISPVWREFAWGWSGVPRNANNSAGTVDGGISTTDGGTFGRFASRLFIPRVRSREVRFRAVGLMPNARHWPFFDGVDVSDYCVQGQGVGNGGSDFVDAGETDQWSYSRRRNNWVWTGQTAPSGSTEPFPMGAMNGIYWHPFWGDTTPTDSQRALVAGSNGDLNGSIFLPNNDQLSFLSGVKEFKLIDNTTGNVGQAGSWAAADYTADALVDVTITKIMPPRPKKPKTWTDNIGTAQVNQPGEGSNNMGGGNTGDTSGFAGGQCGLDPLAQSFFINNADGAFVTKVGVYFKTKDSDLNIVAAYLCPMVNGYPQENGFYKGAFKALTPSQVNISDDATAVTTFEFDSPVYLPAGEHCLIVRSVSVEYRVFIAKIGEHYVGQTETKITKQPSLGSLFRSQNASTWTAGQFEDMKFDLYRADFATSGVAILSNTLLEEKVLVPNPFLFDSASTTVRVIHPNHGMYVDDVIQFSGIDSDASWPMTTNSIVGNRTITAIDGSGYTFEADSAASSSLRTGGYNVTAPDNILMDTIYPQIDVMSPNGTGVDLSGRFVTGKSFAGAEAPYGLESTYGHNLTPYDAYNFTNPRMIMSSHFEEDGSFPNRSALIQANLETISSFVSPVLDMSRASITAINNLIDKQDSAATVGYNVPISIIQETDPIGGTHLAKYVTKPVTLEEDAVGLRIIFAANRPSVSDFLVYYKVAQNDDNLNEVAWQLVEKEADVKSDENPNVFRDYRYLIGGLSGIDEPFSTFRVKIVMRSTNSSKVPVFRDFRAIALTV